ncbi:MAG TPA: hypothetical protein V6C71_11680 [Coleofasciculaceae cyanobacterium]|jgi:hypothetical protein
MKRPSNLIFTFIFALAGVFLAYALGRIIVRAISPPEIEIEDDYKSQLYIPHRDPFEPQKVEEKLSLLNNKINRL